MTTENSASPDLFLDMENEWVRCGDQRWKLTAKAFAVLRYLTEHASRLVTKKELLQAVWPNTVVSEWALTTCIREIRKTLDDNSRTPRYIETVHRRGYRFLPTVITQSVQSSRCKVPNPPPPALETPGKMPTFCQPGTRNLEPGTFLAGREAELAQLHRWFAKALRGERQLVFITGEPGIGKTALVEAFFQRLAANGQRLASSEPSIPLKKQTLDTSPRIGRGQCFDQSGPGEAYLPVLEALGRLCRAPGHKDLVKVLRQYAPTWLAQMPALLTSQDRETLPKWLLGATRKRMLRELAEALEIFTAHHPLILCFEDLHWSDSATVDFLSYLARRTGQAKLLMLGTYRPAEIIVRAHPLGAVKQELQTHERCAELPLELLGKTAVEAYLATTIPTKAQSSPWFRKLAHLIYQRTEGNPLFMVNVTHFLLAHDFFGEGGSQWESWPHFEQLADGMPSTIRRMIETQLERLSGAEQELLEIASVAGRAFSAAAAATGLAKSIEEVEQRCHALAQRGLFLQTHGEHAWPDGTVAGEYRFLHALYRQVIYERLTTGHRARLHRAIGLRKEQGYREQAREHAATLAAHFSQGRDYPRAFLYHRQAAENAFGRHAYQEAAEHWHAALALRERAPSALSDEEELPVLTALGSVLMLTKGYADPETERIYARAWRLSQDTAQTTSLFSALWGLFYFHFVRTDFDLARELGAQCFELAQREQDPILLLLAHEALGILSFHQGEFTVAREHLERGNALYNPQIHAVLALRYGQDVGVICLGYEALTLWELGYPQQARTKCEEALTLAAKLSHPYSQAVSLIFAAWLCQVSGERPDEIEARGRAAIQLSSDCGFPEQLGHAKELRGWALLRQGALEDGLSEMREGFAMVEATGSAFAKPNFLAVLAEAQATRGRFREGLETLVQALAITHKTGERHYEAELYRLKGELLLQRTLTTQSPSAAKGNVGRTVSKGRTLTRKQ